VRGAAAPVRGLTRLTLPSLRDGPLPLPPEGRRGALAPDIGRRKPAYRIAVERFRGGRRFNMVGNCSGGARLAKSASPGLVAADGFRFRWAVLQIKGRTGQAQTLWRDASVDHECRRVGDWPSLHYYRHAVIDNADWAAVDEILRMKNITPQTASPEEFQRTRNHQANGMAGLPLVGDPDAVAQDMTRLAALGLRGIAVSFVNYLDELPFFCAEVLPRLARAGLREPPGSAAARVPA